MQPTASPVSQFEWLFKPEQALIMHARMCVIPDPYSPSGTDRLGGNHGWAMMKAVIGAHAKHDTDESLAPTCCHKQPLDRPALVDNKINSRAGAEWWTIDLLWLRKNHIVWFVLCCLLPLASVHLTGSHQRESVLQIPGSSPTNCTWPSALSDKWQKKACSSIAASPSLVPYSFEILLRMQTAYKCLFPLDQFICTCMQFWLHSNHHLCKDWQHKPLVIYSIMATLEIIMGKAKLHLSLAVYECIEWKTWEQTYNKQFISMCVAAGIFYVVEWPLILLMERVWKAGPCCE